MDAESDSNQCSLCNRCFRSSRGLNQHLRCCQNRHKSDTTNNLQAQGSNSDISADINLAKNDATPVIVKYKWGVYNNNEFEHNVNVGYNKILHWRKNIFLLPTGQAGKRFIEENIRLMNQWLIDLPMKEIAFKAIISK